ncbi:MAG: NUDIX domain-containing protein [Alphaproteobacteria bacterium]
MTGATSSARRLDDAFIAAVNRRFSGRAVLVAQVDDPPEPREVGPAPLSGPIAESRLRWLDRLAAEGRPNEPHAMLRATGDLTAHADYSVIDFATVCAIRETGAWPPILSGGALAVCRARGRVLLQRRSRWVSTYPGCLDIVGGAFQPPVGGACGDADLRATIAREFVEETGIAVDCGGAVPAVIAGQLRVGFTGYVQLGLDVAADDLDRAAPTQEGALSAFDAEALAEALSGPEEDWVPTARLHVLAWLALGARAVASGTDTGAVFPDQTVARLLAG